ncbi:MAG: mannanase [Ignavibacteriales bacterium]|nr:mannanase [Ignavibacteriales bacterium]
MFSGCAGFWPFGEHDDFVKVRGTQFIHNDEPYYFVGTNLWYACYLGSPGSGGDQARLKRELDSLEAMGITNIRMLAGSELSEMKRTLKPSITPSPGVHDDTLLLGLDFALAEMAKRKMKAILFLTNYWEWSGGMAQYIVWADSVPVFDADQLGWDKFMDFSATFYKNERAVSMYRVFVTSILTRRNNYNNRLYRDDPTIMSWQLANEPRPGADSAFSEANLPNFFRWINETAAYIKSLDSNHLVSIGSEGIVGTLSNGEYYRFAHSSPHVDYLTMHLWPAIWRWFDPRRQLETFRAGLDTSKAYIVRHFPVARVLQKPLVLEEFGIVRDSANASIDFPVSMRDNFYESVFALVYDSARYGAPIAGTNFWAWGGEGRAKQSDRMWREGDPFTGDPAHEPQGMHSVFNTDRSTIAVIRYFAQRMNGLKKIDSLQTKFSL